MTALLVCWGTAENFRQAEQAGVACASSLRSILQNQGTTEWAWWMETSRKLIVANSPSVSHQRRHSTLLGSQTV